MLICVTHAKWRFSELSYHKALFPMVFQDWPNIYLSEDLRLKWTFSHLVPASLSFRKLEKNLFLAFESQFNIKMCSLGTCKTSFYTAVYKRTSIMHNLVTSYGFQLGQNHWTWIWIYSLHTAEEWWIGTQCVVRVLQRIPSWPHDWVIWGTDTDMSGTCVHI